MQINVAKSAGFCFGVKRAIRIALKAARSLSNIEMLGDIVHNEDVVNDIKNSGIRKVKTLSSGKNKSLLIRAHGVEIKTIKKAQELGYEIIDATCPMVKEIHGIAISMEKENRKIIIIGDKKHAEVKGIIGQIKTKPIVISDSKVIPFSKIKKIKKAAIVAQSTQNISQVKEIVKVLNEQIPDLKFFNTICNPTRKKQSEIKAMPLRNDVMIIIGSKTSANTKRLYEISKSLNKHSYWVQSKRNLRKEWFNEVQNVGISAGASTPDYTTKEIIKQINILTTL